MSNAKTDQEIIGGLKPVCICKGIKKRSILDRTKAGVPTVEELKKATCAGSGPCKEGIGQGRLPDLTGGGLVRSKGGLPQVLSARRSGRPCILSSTYPNI